MNIKVLIASAVFSQNIGTKFLLVKKMICGLHVVLMLLNMPEMSGAAGVFPAH